MNIRILTNDNLSEMSDDRINRIIDSLVRTARRYGNDGAKAQVELCYAQREIEWRRKRREAHQVYLKSLPNYRPGPRQGPRRGPRSNQNSKKTS